LLAFANSTAAETLVHRLSVSGSGRGGRHLERSCSGRPQCEAKKTGSDDANNVRYVKDLKNRLQFGCFQFNAVQTEGENETKEIRRRE
jgi:hypothetical protein